MFVTRRSTWDAGIAVGDHSLFTAVLALFVAALTAVLASRGDALLALVPLGAVVLMFLAVVAFYLVGATSHPDRHREWERLDYGGMSGGLMKLEIRQLGPLRMRSYRDPEKPLLCRVVAPNGSSWVSERPVEGQWAAAGRESMRLYPSDFSCSSCGQQPPSRNAGSTKLHGSSHCGGVYASRFFSTDSPSRARRLCFHRKPAGPTQDVD
jgi:4-amino-4-deoxy-L-arabinose transferase-like glycosyltransferase